MTIPSAEALMLPVLRHCSENTWLGKDLVARISDDLGLSQGEREARLPGGSQTTIYNRVQWAKTYLKQARLLEQPKRAYVQISQRGREVLSKNPEKVDIKLLENFEEFRAFQHRTRPDNRQETEQGGGLSGPTPEE